MQKRLQTGVWSNWLAYFLWCVPLTGLAQPDAPRWEHHSNNTITTIPFVLTTKIDVVLNLSTNHNDAWLKYEEEKEKFKRWFEDEQVELEQDYANVMGDAKIESAKNLIRFILKAKTRWQIIQIPSHGKWDGTYTVRLSMPPSMLSLNSVDKANISLELFRDSFEDLLSGRIQGKAENGNLNYNIKITFDGESVGAFEGGGTWSGKIAGRALPPDRADIVVNLKQHSFDMSGGLPSIGFYGSTKEGKGTGGAFFYDLNKVYNITPPVDISYENEWNFDIPLTLTGWLEEYDFQKFLNTYFLQYANTIDTVKQKQLQALTTVEDRRAKTRRVFRLLTVAASYGYASGVDESIIEKAGLIAGKKGSLYDQWYVRWLDFAMLYWEEKIASSTELAAHNWLWDRFISIVEEIMYGNLALLSEELIQQIQLYIPSGFVDNLYTEYYTTVLNYWKEKVEQDKSNLQDGQKWVIEQVAYAQAFSLISDGLKNRFGLDVWYPKDYLLLQEIAGDEQ